MSKKPKPNPESLWMLSASTLRMIADHANSILKLVDPKPMAPSRPVGRKKRSVKSSVKP